MASKSSCKSKRIPKSLLQHCLRNANVSFRCTDRITDLEALVLKYKLDPTSELKRFSLTEDLPEELVLKICESLALTASRHDTATAKSLVSLGATCKVISMHDLRGLFRSASYSTHILACMHALHAVLICNLSGSRVSWRM